MGNLEARFRDLTPVEVAASRADQNATNATPATNAPWPPATNGAKTPNRRDRIAYNAYQRDYMRKRRAAKK